LASGGVMRRITGLFTVLFFAVFVLGVIPVKSAVITCPVDTSLMEVPGGFTCMPNVGAPAGTIPEVSSAGIVIVPVYTAVCNAGYFSQGATCVPCPQPDWSRLNAHFLPIVSSLPGTTSIEGCFLRGQEHFSQRFEIWEDAANGIWQTNRPCYWNTETQDYRNNCTRTIVFCAHGHQLNTAVNFGDGILRSCTPCAPGRMARQTMHLASEFVDGEIIPAYGNAVCTLCQMGTFNPYYGQEQCTACPPLPPNTSSTSPVPRLWSVSGATNIEQCAADIFFLWEHDGFWGSTTFGQNHNLSRCYWSAEENAYRNCDKWFQWCRPGYRIDTAPAGPGFMNSCVPCDAGTFLGADDTNRLLDGTLVEWNRGRHSCDCVGSGFWSGPASAVRNPCPQGTRSGGCGAGASSLESCIPYRVINTGGTRTFLRRGVRGNTARHLVVEIGNHRYFGNLSTDVRDNTVRLVIDGVVYYLTDNVTEEPRQTCFVFARNDSGAPADMPFGGCSRAINGGPGGNSRHVLQGTTYLVHGLCHNSGTERPGIDGNSSGGNHCWCRIISEHGHLYNWMHVMEYVSATECSQGANQCAHTCIRLFRENAFMGLGINWFNFIAQGRVDESLFSWPQQDISACTNQQCGIIINSTNVSHRCTNTTGEYMSMIGC